MEKLLEILDEIRPDLDFGKETSLIDDGLLDSFDIISIVTELNVCFDVSINVNDIKPENLNSAKCMWELVCMLRGK